MLICIHYFLVLITQIYAGIVKGPDSTLIITRVLSLTSNVETIGYHQWHHDYGIGNTSDLMPVVNGSKSTYQFYIEKFDNGSNVYCRHIDGGLTVNIKNNILFNCGMQPMKLFLVDDGYYEDKVDKISEYNDNSTFRFECVKHPYVSSTTISDVFVGWINPNTDKMSVLAKRRGDNIRVKLTLNKTYNSSMICCIYYTTRASSSHTQIQRYVTHKTRLIWKDNSEPQTTKSTTSTSTAKYTETDVESTERDQSFKEDDIKYLANRSNDSEDGLTLNGNKFKNNVNREQSDTHETKDSKSLILGVGSGVLLVLTIIVLAVVVLVKKHNSNSGRGSPRLDQKHVNVASPFYLNLLFREECNKEINKIEQEHYYEEIL
ncbi:unnamed protein product [Spodoptera littoralis]|uniref:Uncharacterized protein n=1 Tax=Spodoptera littoralis TaxID=7109 RepID=A0A9P0I6D8_SPOLI|nr:unnamed protein product [Spodoptera littoralis]CAH1642306.1 unnamed protein product [Spodoptera littoralis]